MLLLLAEKVVVKEELTAPPEVPEKEVAVLVSCEFEEGTNVSRAEVEGREALEVDGGEFVTSSGRVAEGDWFGVRREDFFSSVDE